MRYSDDQKLAVVLDYESGNDGQKVVARRHGVEATSLRNWVAAYRAQGIDGITRCEASIGCFGSEGGPFGADLRHWKSPNPQLSQGRHPNEPPQECPTHV